MQVDPSRGTSRFSLKTLASAACAGLLTLSPAGAIAQDASGLRVELNKLEPRDKACRTYLLLDNTSDVDYQSLKLDLFVLDKAGVISQRLVVETAPLPPKKTTVKLFDFPATSCDDFGRVLLNGVTACEAGGTARTDCLAAIETATKSPVPFTK